jgi:hypothetical protein
MACVRVAPLDPAYLPTTCHLGEDLQGLLAELSSKPEVSQLHAAIGAHQHVGGLDVPAVRERVGWAAIDDFRPLVQVVRRGRLGAATPQHFCHLLDRNQVESQSAAQQRQLAKH